MFDSLQKSVCKFISDIRSAKLSFADNPLKFHRKAKIKDGKMMKLGFLELNRKFYRVIDI